jgi:hypothetical protein
MTDQQPEPADATRFLDGKSSMWPGDVQPLDDEDDYINIGGGCRLTIVDTGNWRVRVTPPGHTGRPLYLASPVAVGGAAGRKAIAAVLYEWANPSPLDEYTLETSGEGSREALSQL